MVEELETRALADVETTVMVEVAANSLMNVLDHTATHKMPLAQVRPAPAKVIAVLRFPQTCPRIVILVSVRIS